MGVGRGGEQRLGRWLGQRGDSRRHIEPGVDEELVVIDIGPAHGRRLTKVVAHARQSKQTGLVVEEVVELVDGEFAAAEKRQQRARINIARTGAHDEPSSGVLPMEVSVVSNATIDSPALVSCSVEAEPS